MDRFEDDLRQALSEETTFDHERANILKQEVVKMFGAKLRKVERVTWGYLVGCVALAAFAAVRFAHSAETKELILYGVAFLLAIETQVLIKLWYWIMNNKLSVLKEIKQMRLEVREPSRETLGPTPSESDDSDGEPSIGVAALSKWERRAWLICVVIVAGAAGFIAAGLPGPLKPVMTSERYVTLAADDTGSVLTRMSFRHEDIMPLTTFRFHAPGPIPERAAITLLDERGRQLPMRFEPTDTGYFSVWTVAEPVMPGESCSLKMIGDATAQKQGDLWVYESDWDWGYRLSLFRETVMLPRGAQIVSVNPEPEMQFQWAGLPGVRFRTQRGPNEHFRYTIKYRLP